jgi:hypothetical protein
MQHTLTQSASSETEFLIDIEMRVRVFSRKTIDYRLLICHLSIDRSLRCDIYFV